MDPLHALRGKTVAAVDEAQMRLAMGGEPDLRAYGHPVGHRAFQEELHPVSAGRQDVVIEVRLGVGVGDEQVEPAVIIKVSYCNSAPVPN